MVRTKTWGCQRSTKLTLNWTSFNAQCICFSFLFSSRIGRQRDTFKSPIHFCFNLCTYFIELLNYQIMSEKITMDSGVVYKTLLVWTIIIFRNSICWLFCWLHLYLLIEIVSHLHFNKNCILLLAWRAVAHQHRHCSFVRFIYFLSYPPTHYMPINITYFHLDSYILF